jgi:transcriptional regulator of heat shock response
MDVKWILRIESAAVGILGVVGPRRLPYPDVISAVEETARQVTEALSRVRQDLYLPS